MTCVWDNSYRFGKLKLFCHVDIISVSVGVNSCVCQFHEEVPPIGSKNMITIGLRIDKNLSYLHGYLLSGPVGIFCKVYIM